MLKITKFKYFNCIMRVFWLNIAKFKVNWCYRYCFNLFTNLEKRVNCGNTIAEIQQKLERER